MTSFVLIDKQRLQAIKVCPTVRQCQYWAAIKVPDGDYFIADTSRNRNFTSLSMQELCWVYSHGGGSSGRFDNYTDALLAVRAIIERMPVDDTDETTLAELLGQVLPKTDEKAIAEDLEVRGEKYAYFISNEEANSFYQHGELIARGNSGILQSRNNSPHSNTNEVNDMATKKAAKAAGKKAKPKASGKKATTRASNPDRVEQNGVVRPREGGNTYAVWSAADAAAKKKKAPPTFKEVEAVLGKHKIPMATCRAQYAAWKKFNGVSGRVE